jgi:hypothetical protein
MVRIAALVVVIGATLAAAPAVAQFGNIFGDSQPPRPPADIPNGPFPPQPPPASYPGDGAQSYPGPGASPPYQGAGAPQPYPAALPPGSASPPRSAIQADPLPPPPGVGVAPVPGPGQNFPQQRPAPAERARAVPPAGNVPPPGGAVPPNAAAPAANNNGPAPPEGADAPPTEDTLIEKPTEHIDNGRAVFSGLDKITGRTFSFDAAIGETVRFGALEVTPRACYTRPPTEATNTDAFVEVDEVTLKGEIKRIFTGWMFASSPGLHAVEHPIYDVWLTSCAAPVQTSQAEPVAAAPPPAQPRHPAPPRQRTTRPPARPLARAPQPEPQPQ